MDQEEKRVYQVAYIAVDAKSDKIISFRVTKGMMFMIPKSLVL